MEKEIWKSVPNYDGLYEASSLGRIKSLQFGREKNLKHGLRKDGYLQVVLYKNKNKEYVMVHRIIAITFLENPLKLIDVNHKDEIKSNNNIENLEFCSRRYNINYGNRTEKARKSNTNGIRSKKVIQILNGLIINEFESVGEVKRVLGFNQGNISHCCNGRQNTAYGYKWKYKE